MRTRRLEWYCGEEALVYDLVMGLCESGRSDRAMGGFVCFSDFHTGIIMVIPAVCPANKKAECSRERY